MPGEAMLAVTDGDAGDLAAWLAAEDELRGHVRRVPAAVPAGALGAELAQLAVSLASGGTATALASTVIAWLLLSWQWPARVADGVLDSELAPGQISQDGRLMASLVNWSAAAPFVLRSGAVSSAAHTEIAIWSLAGSASPTLDAVIPVADISDVEFLSARVLLIVDGEGRTRLWDLRDPGHPAPGTFLGTTGTSKAEQFSGDTGAESADNIADVEAPDGRLQLWRITSAAGAVQAGSIPGNPGDAGILQDGHTAFRVTGNKIQWWDISVPAHPVLRGASTLPGSGSLSTVSESGTLLVATVKDPASAASDLVLFDVVKGRVLSSATLSTTVGTDLNVSAGNRLLAVADGGDNAVTLWDISNPEQPVPLASISTPLGGDVSNSGFASTEELVLGMAFTGQGDTLAISDGTTTSLDGDPAQLAARLCEYVGVPVSAAQWRQDAPGVPYRRPCP